MTTTRTIILVVENGGLLAPRPIPLTNKVRPKYDLTKTKYHQLFALATDL